LGGSGQVNFPDNIFPGPAKRRTCACATPLSAVADSKVGAGKMETRQATLSLRVRQSLLSVVFGFACDIIVVL